MTSLKDLLTGNFEGKINDLEHEVTLVKHTLHDSSLVDAPSESKVKVHKAKPFGGALNAKKLENFLWDMDEYFKTTRIPKGEQINWLMTPNFGGAQGLRMSQGGQRL